jgi:hypothetical protein
MPGTTNLIIWKQPLTFVSSIVYASFCTLIGRRLDKMPKEKTTHRDKPSITRLQGVNQIVIPGGGETQREASVINEDVDRGQICWNLCVRISRRRKRRIRKQSRTEGRKTVSTYAGRQTRLKAQSGSYAAHEILCRLEGSDVQVADMDTDLIFAFQFLFQRFESLCTPGSEHLFININSSYLTNQLCKEF